MSDTEEDVQLPLSPEEQLEQAAPGEVTPEDAANLAKKPHKMQMNFHGADGKKKFRPGPKMRAAIWEIVARKRAGWKAEYKITAEKHGVKWQSLETLCRRHAKGLIDLGDPLNCDQKKEIDLRAELQRSLTLLGSYEKHLNDTFEALLKKAQAELKDGNYLAFDQLQIPKVVGQLSLTTGLRAKKEKGVLEILGKLMELQRTRDAAELAAREPKPLNGTVVELPPKLNQATAAAVLQNDAITKIRNVLAQPIEPEQE